jgi:hypothetical protein
MRKTLKPMQQFGATSLGILISAGLLGGLPALAQPPADTPDIKPIKSLWLASPPVFPNTSERDAAYTKGLKEWRDVFDAYILIKLPPTFSDEKNFTAQAKTLIREVGGQFIIVTLPVGNEGWESSANQRFAEKHQWHYDAGKSMSQIQWLTTLKDLDSGTWEWVLEGAAQMPTPEQAARSASEFVKYAKSQHKKAVIWLSGEGFGIPKFKAMIESVCKATRDDADYFGWMDLQSASLRSGESNWRESLGGLLDQILTLTPKEKTVIQWEHNPKWPAKDVAGTKAYIGVCQAKGINRFSALSRPEFLDRDPWREFYRALPREGR